MNISAGVDSLNAFSKERNMYLYGNIRDASKPSVFDEREAMIYALFNCFWSRAALTAFLLMIEYRFLPKGRRCRTPLS